MIVITWKSPLQLPVHCSHPVGARARARLRLTLTSRLAPSSSSRRLLRRARLNLRGRAHARVSNFDSDTRLPARPRRRPQLAAGASVSQGSLVIYRHPSRLLVPFLFPSLACLHARTAGTGETGRPSSRGIETKAASTFVRIVGSSSICLFVSIVRIL